MDALNVILFVVCCLGFLNIYVSVQLYYSKIYTNEQKKYQALLIWGLPFIGAISVLSVMYSDQTSQKYRSSEEKGDVIPGAPNGSGRRCDNNDLADFNGSSSGGGE